MTRFRRGALALVGILFVALFAETANAVSTRTFTTVTFKDFDEGEAENALISSVGEVRPGLASARVDLETDAVWTAIRAPDGTIYAGGISDGTIYAVSGGKKRTLAIPDADSPWIGALALGADGTLYAGTVGTATLYAIDTRTGLATKLVSLAGAEHIWALAFDESGKRLYAGTGPNGQLFQIDLAKKSASVIWSSEEPHLLAVTAASDGSLWIGTADGAILYRFDPKIGLARAIADFSGSEVKAVVELATTGAFVVAANEFEAKPTTPPAPPPAKGPKGTAAKLPEVGTSPGADKPKAEGALPARPGERKGKGALFRVDASGRVEQLHALTDGYFQSLAVAADGAVFAAAGAQGRIYEVLPDRTILTAVDVPERQVNAVMTFANGLAFATGDGGAVYTATGPAKDATYTTKVFDAQFPARWGNLRWRSDAGLVVETRSGNTSKPDRGWSAWVRPASPAKAGGGATIGRIASPIGRYLQVRSSWDGGVQALRELTVYYLPQNQRARITELNVGDAAEAAKRPPVTLAAGVTKPRSPVVKLRWKVENPDDDELAYRLEVRPIGDVDWRDVATGDGPFTKTELEWNTEELADGYLQLRATATDSRANPADETLDSAFVSAPFLVDNRKPEVVGLVVKAPFVSGRATDTFSRIGELAYAIDGGDWQVVAPADGIFDDVSEAFAFKLPGYLTAGTHALSVRAADEADNIGMTSVTFRVGTK